MPTPSDGARLRAAQVTLRRLLVAEFEQFFGALDLTKPEAAREALLAYTPALVDRYGVAAASVAAEWYDELRAAEGIPGRFRAAAIVPDESVAIRETVRRAAGHLFTDNPNLTLLGISSKAGKYALDGSRATVTTSSIRDPRSSGWQRVTRAGACRFCRMLAGRGGVYREASADFASHDDCNCAAQPSWDAEAPEVDVKLYEASKRTSTMSPEQRERHREAVHEALDIYVPDED